MHDEIKMNDNFIYMIERLREMLFDYSIDIYRVPLLCTPLLVREYIETEKEIRRSGRVPFSRLDPIKEELLNSFDNDEIIKCILLHEERMHIRRMLDSSDSLRVLEGCRYLRGKIPLSNYYNSLVEELKNVISSPKEKEKLEAILRILPAVLHGRGYSHEYIYYVFNGVDAPATENSRIESKLDDLLSQFDFQLRMFDVYFAFNVSEDRDANLVDEIKNLFEGLDIIEFEDKDEFKAQKESILEHGSYGDKEFSIKMCHIETKSLDAYSAAKAASELFDFGTRSYLLLLNESTPACLPECLVIDRINEKEAFPNCRIQSYKLLKPNPSSRNELVKQSHRSLAVLFGRTKGGAEFDRLTKAIDLHNSSLTINSFQNSFICLWTALEVVCNGNKIINQTLCDALELSYLSRVVEEIEQRLYHSCSSYMKSMRKEHDMGFIECTYSLLFLSDWESARDSLYGKLSENPLTRNRFYRISSLSNGVKMAKHIRAYGKRVSWHIERMYRARNSIVHAGDMPQFLDSLGEHLHMYLDIFMGTILNYFESGDYRYIEDVIAALSYEHKIFFDKLKEANLANHDDLEWFIAKSAK